jgi:putative intracellular protease/amidase
MSDTTAADRCRGVLVGQAAGDRIGGPIRMAVRLAESLLKTGRFDAADVLGRYLGWWREGAFDTGPVSARALALVAAGMPVQEATAQVHREFGGMTAGCNPAHRSPPLSMLATIADEDLAILIFDDVEVLDFCGPFEVFSVANRFTEPPAFTVLTVAENASPVVTRGGLSVNPHRRLADCPQPDVLLVPGGQGTRKEMHNPALIDWIRQASTKAELVLSVCTGALLLAKAGLLDGLEATTHHGAIDLLRHTAPKTTVHADSRFVDNGRVVCSAGIAAGIDMSLHVVSRLLGQEVAVNTARQMEYPWEPDGRCAGSHGHD